MECTTIGMVMNNKSADHARPKALYNTLLAIRRGFAPGCGNASGEVVIAYEHRGRSLCKNAPPYLCTSPHLQIDVAAEHGQEARTSWHTPDKDVKPAIACSRLLGRRPIDLAVEFNRSVGAFLPRVHACLPPTRHSQPLPHMR